MQQAVSPKTEPRRATGKVASRDATHTVRLRVVAAILDDSRQDAHPYVERYSVNRGAE